MNNRKDVFMLQIKTPRCFNTSGVAHRVRANRAPTITVRRWASTFREKL